MSYQSKFYPRPHSITFGKVRSIDTYDMYYDMVRMAVKNHALPTVRLKAGEVLFRKAGNDWNPAQIPPNSAASKDNRFSGRRPDGAPGQGALYLGSASGVLREHAHYGNPGAASLWLPGAKDSTKAFIASQKSGIPLANEKVHVFRALEPVYAADFRLESLFRFFSRHQFDIARRTPLDILVNSISSPADHSAARGMADAIYDSRQQTNVAGLVATSSRGDSDSGLVLESHGDSKGSAVVALQGAAGTSVSELKHVGSFDSVAQMLAELPKLLKG